MNHQVQQQWFFTDDFKSKEGESRIIRGLIAGHYIPSIASSSNPLFPLAPPPLPPPAAAFRNGLEVFPRNLDDPPDTDMMYAFLLFGVFPPSFFFFQKIH